MSVIIDEAGLTGKQVVFIDAYLSNGLNAAQAARTAGYSGDAKQLAVIGAQNLNKISIRTALANRTKRVEKQVEKRSINVYDEFTKNLEFVGKLRDAASKWLIDPDNENLFTIDPRADEIDVIYWDSSSEIPTQKRALLSELLDRVNDVARMPSPFIKNVEPREYALKVADRIDTTIDKFAKMGGEYTRDKANPLDTANDLTTLKSFVETCVAQALGRDVDDEVRLLVDNVLPSETEIAGVH